MATFLYKTKGNADPKGKPKVYFTCHPADFEAHFEKICADIFALHDCAIFYTPNMAETIEEKFRESDLGQMSLFVIPVTYNLLTQPNRTIAFDVNYAKEKHIPLLPIVLETGLDSLYSAQANFGETQYLCPCVQDETAISYQEKLKKFLDAVLVSDETAKRIRKAFRAYIFLSYRKKDRHYANELMKKIHGYPEFYDIAIWYDEFLTPGESFRQSITEMMQDSKLFALLVTPNLLEYVDGEPNFVMKHEYPDARSAKMKIFPAEMEETDHKQLHEKYKDLPECIRPDEDELFQTRLKDALSGVISSEKCDDPEHTFLIGLAYLEGIDVEKDVDRGIAFITSAAQENQCEAMLKLLDIYSYGIGVPVSYQKALLCAERMLDYSVKTWGEAHPTSLAMLSIVALRHELLGNHQKALELQEKYCIAQQANTSERHQDTLIAFHHLANMHDSLGHHEKALEIRERICAQIKEYADEDDAVLLPLLGALANTYQSLGWYERALELNQQVYERQCRILGDEHSDTLTTQFNAIAIYGALGDHEKAAELSEKVYALRAKTLGEEHPNTISALYDLAHSRNMLGNHEEALELYKTVYERQRKILGEEHPYTMATLGNLALCYGDCHDKQKELELQQRCYALRRGVLGEDHPSTLQTLQNLAGAYMGVEDYEAAYQTMQTLYNSYQKIFGKRHPQTRMIKKGLRMLSVVRKLFGRKDQS